MTNYQIGSPPQIHETPAQFEMRRACRAADEFARKQLANGGHAGAAAALEAFKKAPADGESPEYIAAFVSTAEGIISDPANLPNK